MSRNFRAIALLMYLLNLKRSTRCLKPEYHQKQKRKKYECLEPLNPGFISLKFHMFLIFFRVNATSDKVKGLHPIIFVSNIFPNSHLIQKFIQNQQLFQNSCWFCIEFWYKWELGKIFNRKMIECSTFSRALQMASGEMIRWSYECSPLLGTFLCKKRQTLLRIS